MSMPQAHRSLLRMAYGETNLRVERLSGGMRGRCYRVRGARLDHAVRMPAPDRSPFRLTPPAERRVLAAVAAAGLAPPVVETDPALGCVTTEFLEGARAWSPADARQPDNIERLAAHLRKLHACELELPPYAAVAAAERYAAAARARRSLDAAQRAWCEELLERARAFEARFPPLGPCHNDLVASNVLDDGALWLVDFEYAVRSAPILDLAGLAGLNGFDAEQLDRLVAAYHGHAAVPFARAELIAAIRLVRLLAYFWILAVGTGGEAEPEFGTFADAIAAMLR